ncbi:MAG: hypothetical protein CMLOHMNK_02044 [Steroidobacteraceae bacterium]|nr:hypothetical protein [Steroidobacteraceae bacterium]
MKAAAVPFHLKPKPVDPEEGRLKELLSTLLTPPQYRPPTALGLGPVAFPGGGLPPLGPDPGAAYPPQAPPMPPSVPPLPPAPPPVAKASPSPEAAYPAYRSQAFDESLAQGEAARLFPRDPYTRQMDALTRQYQQETEETPPAFDWKHLLLALAGARYGAKGLAAVGSGIERGRQTRQARQERQAQLLLEQRDQLEKERARQEAQADQYVQRRVLQADQTEARAYDRWQQGKQKWEADRQKAAEGAAQKAVAAFSKDLSGYHSLADTKLSAPTLSQMAQVFRVHADALAAHGAPEGDLARRQAETLDQMARQAPAQSLAAQEAAASIVQKAQSGQLSEAMARLALKSEGLKEEQIQQMLFNRTVKGPAEVKRIEQDIEESQARVGKLLTEGKNLQRKYDDEHKLANARLSQIKKQIAIAGTKARTDPRLKYWLNDLSDQQARYEDEHDDFLKKAQELEEEAHLGPKGFFGERTPLTGEAAVTVPAKASEYKQRAARAAAKARQIAAQKRALIGGGGQLPPMPVGVRKSMKPGAKPYDANDPSTW